MLVAQNVCSEKVTKFGKYKKRLTSFHFFCQDSLNNVLEETFLKDFFGGAESPEASIQQESSFPQIEIAYTLTNKSSSTPAPTPLKLSSKFLLAKV